MKPMNVGASGSGRALVVQAEADNSSEQAKAGDAQQQSVPLPGSVQQTVGIYICPASHLLDSTPTNGAARYANQNFVSQRVAAGLAASKLVTSDAAAGGGGAATPLVASDVSNKLTLRSSTAEAAVTTGVSSAQQDMDYWPALAILGSSGWCGSDPMPATGSMPQAQQQVSAPGMLCSASEDPITGAAINGARAAQGRTALQASSNGQEAQQQQQQRGCAWPAPPSHNGSTIDWENELDGLLREQNKQNGQLQQQQQQPPLQQQQPGHQQQLANQQQQPHQQSAGQAAPQQQQQPQQPLPAQQQTGSSAAEPERTLDGLRMEQEELQLQQRRRWQPVQANPAVRFRAAAPVNNWQTGDWDDELDDLLMQEQELLQRQGQQQQRLQDPPSPQLSSASFGAGNIADLGAELDELDGFQHSPANSTGNGCKRSRTDTAAAAAPAGFHFGDELDALLEEQEGAAHVNGQQHATDILLEPARLVSLGAGQAAMTAAESLAALQAAAVPPRQFASAIVGRSVTVTGTSGQRVYCQLAASSSGTASASSSCVDIVQLCCRSGVSGLLAEPLDALLDKQAERRKQEVLAEYAASQALADEMSRVARGNEHWQGSRDAAAAEGGHLGDQDQQKQQQQEQQDVAAAPASVQRQLWVDKYAPKSFLSLLSEPRVNREIATWVARWKKQRHQGRVDCQLGPGRQQQQHGQDRQQTPAPAPAAGGKGGRHARGGRTGGHSGRGGEGGKSSNISGGFDVARYLAAQQARAAANILLVVGPPGTGKTTLAHVIATHCGFRVMEVNASDERTAASLTRRILDAAQMQPVLDGTCRHPCIILDELDGAASGAEGYSAVAALVKLITGQSGNVHRKRCRSGQPAQAAGSGCRGLGVPIIATANDAWASCLRPLREVAAVYHFKAPAPDKLTGRLAAIAAAEGILTDKQALALLVERSGCDVRTAINTLQFLARQQAGAAVVAAVKAGNSQGSSCRRVCVTAAAVSSSGAMGLKDIAKSGMGILKDLLSSNSSRAISTRLQQHSVVGLGGSSRNIPAVGSAAAAARLQLQEQYDMLLDLGDHELVLCGLQEALPEAVGLDVDLAATVAATAALADADRLMAGSKSNRGGGVRGMYQYAPACLLAASRAVKREGDVLGARSGPTWPRAQADCARSAAANHALLRSWRAGAPAAAQQLGCGAAALLDLAPGLVALSRPAAVRGVNKQLLSGDEAQLMAHVVDVMMSYGLSYDFAADDSEQQVPSYAAAAAGVDNPQPQPRIAPLAPAIDTLHSYYGFHPAAATAHGGTSSSRPGWGKGMPLLLRQMMNQMITTANITRLEQARHGAEGVSPSKVTARGGATPPAGPQQLTRGTTGAPMAAKYHTAAAKAAALPKAAAKPAKGCWLDALKARTAPKRKAAAPAARDSSAAKRHATEAAGTEMRQANQEASQLLAATYVVLYKFNEGYTNAVKRPMKMRELLQ